ncbi:hypothetical protein HHI36_017592 [Cryptolaemus montrouzieri]|uniref:Uncharacterized protein n=1 Tax=Cryptolaemus montrouzieri TaxID=559131 RepID=A0ABD2NMU4_9CUCU
MKTLTEHRKYVKARNRVNRQIREIKREHWRTFSKDKEDDMYGTQRRIWNMLRAWKKQVNEYVQLNQVSAVQWEQYRIELYNNEESENDSERRADLLEEEEIVVVMFSNQSITKAIQKHKNRKAPGIDNITIK